MRKVLTWSNGKMPSIKLRETCADAQGFARSKIDVPAKAVSVRTQYHAAGKCLHLARSHQPIITAACASELSLLQYAGQDNNP